MSNSYLPYKKYRTSLSFKIESITVKNSHRIKQLFAQKRELKIALASTHSLNILKSCR